MRYLVSIFTIFLATSQAWAECNEVERRPWTNAAKFGLSIEARAVGPSCATSAIVLLVTNKNDEVLWTFIREAKSMMWFQDEVGDGAAMKLGLKNWLDSAFGISPNSTAELPDWKEGADGPTRDGDGEFGYYTEADRLMHMERRAAAEPMFCFVSGIESTTCLAASSGKYVTDIGGFSFPG